STLFLCHNPHLANRLAGLTRGSGVSVAPFGDWVASLGGDGQSLGFNAWTKYEEPDPASLNRAFEILLEHCPRYGAVIIDEGQDFRREWWDVVEAALDPSGPRILYVFHDDHQTLLPYRATYPFDEPVIDMSRNCRNAGKIYSLMRNIFHEAPLPEDRLKELGDVLLMTCARSDEANVLRRAVTRIAPSPDSTQLCVLLRSGATFEQSLLSRLTLPIQGGPGWKDEVIRVFSS